MSGVVSLRRDGDQIGLLPKKKKLNKNTFKKGPQITKLLVWIAASWKKPEMSMQEFQVKTETFSVIHFTAQN